MSEQPKAGEGVERPAAALPRGEGPRGAFDGTLLSRYECKYRLSPELVPDVRRYVSSFVRPDRYAARSPRNSYVIASLYLDSADLGLYRMNMDGSTTRHKLRIRAYDDEPGTPVFFEIKRRLEGIVKKRRAQVSREDARRFLQAHLCGGRGASAPNLADAAEFGRLAGELRAAPVLRVRYLREAYESSAGDPVRVTFDSGVEYAVSLDGDLSVVDGRWCPTPVQGVVLEIKFTDLFPSWVEGVVSEFDLQRDSVAKYALSVDHALRSGALRRFVPHDFEFAL